MIDATFINTNDNVPFRRVYKTLRGFNTAIVKLKGVKFLYAIDKGNDRIIYPEHVRKD